LPQELHAARAGAAPGLPRPGHRLLRDEHGPAAGAGAFRLPPVAAAQRSAGAACGAPGQHEFRRGGGCGMSFLAPLYIAGALAVALPIIFHLIRRTPQGRQEFSSLMFLAPSPPRITRRSRLSNIVLLLLRAAALCLLAFAFA